MELVFHALQRPAADGWNVTEVQPTTAASNLHPDGIAAWPITCVRT